MRKFSANFASAISLFLFIALFAFTGWAQDSTAVHQKNNLADETETASATAANSSAQNNSYSDTKNEFSIQGGFAPFGKALYGGGRHSSYGFASFRYSRHLIGSENVALKYTFDVIPLAFITYDQEPVVQTGPNTFVVQKNRKTVYGFSLTPVGFQLNFRRQKKIQPFLNANAGLIRFAKTVPDDRSVVFPNRYGRQFNYTLAGGGGVEFLTEGGKSFTVGFKFHHISNASTGNINPGFDQNLFYFGYTFKKW